jgi:uncharacterized protein (TIGR02421 family)
VERPDVPSPISDAADAADAALAEVAGAFDYLFYVSPTNSGAARRRFIEAGHREAPAFTYRDVHVDGLRRRLDALPLDDVDDPRIARLLEGKRHELDHALGLLATRGTPAFLDHSLAKSGGVGDDLLRLAEGILDEVGGRDDAEGDPGRVSPEAWAARAEQEIAAYRTQDPELSGSVHVRDDIGSLMVSGSTVLVPADRRIRVDRVEALIHHEVGVHLLTWWNGTLQPLRMLADGLGGYIEAQEGLGVLAEWCVDGLTAERLQVLAARVVAARSVIDGADFGETFADLHDGRGIPAEAAFDLAERVHRGGGLVKDADYLRGVLRILERLQAGGALEPLLVGKPAIDDLDDIAALLDAGVLRPPRLRPLWAEGPGADRLALLREGGDPTALLLR